MSPPYLVKPRAWNQLLTKVKKNTIYICISPRTENVSIQTYLLLRIAHVMRPRSYSMGLRNKKNLC